MKELDAAGVRDLCGERPKLGAWLESVGAVSVWLLSDRPTTWEAETAGKKYPLLLVKAAPNRFHKDGAQYIVRSAPGAGKDKEGKKRPDTVTAWLADEISLPGEPAAAVAPPSGGGYVIIDKSKLGRPRRELTGEEVERIHEKRAAGMSINAIARALKVGNRRVMEILKEGAKNEPGE